MVIQLLKSEFFVFMSFDKLKFERYSIVLDIPKPGIWIWIFFNFEFDEVAVVLH